jgi:hypothetical protein
MALQNRKECRASSSKQEDARHCSTLPFLLQERGVLSGKGILSAFSLVQPFSFAVDGFAAEQRISAGKDPITRL